MKTTNLTATRTLVKSPALTFLLKFSFSSCSTGVTVFDTVVDSSSICWSVTTGNVEALEAAEEELEMAGDEEMDNVIVDDRSTFVF